MDRNQRSSALRSDRSACLTRRDLAQHSHCASEFAVGQPLWRFWGSFASRHGDFAAGFGRALRPLPHQNTGVGAPPAQHRRAYRFCARVGIGYKAVDGRASCSGASMDRAVDARRRSTRLERCKARIARTHWPLGQGRVIFGVLSKEIADHHHVILDVKDGPRGLVA